MNFTTNAPDFNTMHAKLCIGIKCQIKSPSRGHSFHASNTNQSSLNRILHFHSQVYPGVYLNRNCPLKGVTDSCQKMFLFHSFEWHEHVTQYVGPRLLGMFLRGGYVYIVHAGEGHKLLRTLLKKESLYSSNQVESQIARLACLDFK